MERKMSYKMIHFASRVRDMREQRIEVFLREYDASPLGLVKPTAEFFTKFLGSVFPRRSFEWLKHRGIVHTSVELKCGYAAIEIHFGNDGIIYSEPGKSAFGNEPQKITEFGYTEMTVEEIYLYLKKLGSGEFAKAKYDLLDNNCNNFSNEVCKKTVGKGIAQDILDAPTTVIGAALLGLTKLAIGFPVWLKYVAPSFSWLAWPISLFSFAGWAISY